jgi:tuftelin-interacting protein 11
MVGCAFVHSYGIPYLPFVQGTGLGTSGQGIVTPVESKSRPKGNVGIAYGGFKERTKQAITEDKRLVLPTSSIRPAIHFSCRRGKITSDDEDEKGKKRRARKAQGVKSPEERAEAWRTRQTKKKKVVVEHKTYEEIIQAAGLEPSTATTAGVGPIIDATGATLREVSSLAEVSNMASWTPSTDPTRIPEIRHNVRLIVEIAASDVRGLAKEGKALKERKKYIGAEDTRLRKRVTDEAALIERLQRVHLAVDELAAVTKQVHGGDNDALSKLSPGIEKLVKEFGTEDERYGIDEIMVAAIAPAFKANLATWSPLEDPNKMTSILKVWRPALRMSSKPEPDMEVDIYGARRVSTKPML